MLNNTLPVLTLTILKDIVTVSILYCVFAPIPIHLAPNPPTATFESYPIMPPSNISPANNKGFNCNDSLPSY